MSSSRHSLSRKIRDARSRNRIWRNRHKVDLSFQDLEARWLLTNYPVLNTNDTGPDSLRQAITDANGNPGNDSISFNITGNAPFIIMLTSSLPAVTDTVLIDGTTQPGYGGAPVVEISGASAGSGVDGLDLQASGSTISGLVISGFSADGVSVTGPSNLVTGCYIGTDPTGSSAQANSIGIQVSSANKTIGGITPTPGTGLGKLISGNTPQAINIAG